MIEPLWTFSVEDNSIDIVGAIIFAWVAYRCAVRIYKNNLTQPGKIILGMIALLSVLHIVQVAIQIIVGGPIDGFTFRMWDFINYFTAIAFLYTAERTNKKEKY